MKESVITPGMKRREIIIWLICFIAAFIFNVVGIVMFRTPAIEVVTQLHLVLLVSLILYGLAGIFRVLFYLLSRLWVRK